MSHKCTWHSRCCLSSSYSMFIKLFIVWMWTMQCFLRFKTFIFINYFYSLFWFRFFCKHIFHVFCEAQMLFLGIKASGNVLFCGGGVYTRVMAMMMMMTVWCPWDFPGALWPSLSSFSHPMLFWISGTLWLMWGAHPFLRMCFNATAEYSYLLSCKNKIWFLT